MNVLILPENSDHDPHMLEPLLKALFKQLGKPQANVRICRDPSFKGITTALNRANLDEVFQRYDYLNPIYILVVDRDGVEGRETGVEGFRKSFGKPSFFATCAIEEMETWLLAGCKLRPQWRWKDVRSEIKISEGFFKSHVLAKGLSQTVGDGRQKLGQEAAANLPAILKKCKELKILAAQLKEHFS